MSQKISLGQMGEKLAANYLQKNGYKVLDANYFNLRGYRIGEIDIVTEDQEGNIVFIEVKTRKGNKDAIVPEENITNSKLKKLIKSANHYLSKHDLLEKNWRIDSVGIIFDFAMDKYYLRHIKAIRF